MTSPQTRTFQVSLPSSLTEYQDFVQEVLAELTSMEWKKEDLFAVHMALEESISNAIRHGNKEDPEKQVEVEVEVSPDRFYARVRDEGPGYDPNCVPDCCLPENLEVPGGRGLALIRAYMNRVDYTENGRCVTMEKLLE